MVLILRTSGQPHGKSGGKRCIPCIRKLSELSPRELSGKLIVTPGKGERLCSSPNIALNHPFCAEIVVTNNICREKTLIGLTKVIIDDSIYGAKGNIVFHIAVLLLIIVIQKK